MKMRALTLWRPYAEWVAWGWKPIETRLHDRYFCLEGERIAIHAANIWDVGAIAGARRWLTKAQVEQTAALYGTPGGMVLCTAFVYRCDLTKPSDAKKALIECETPRFGLWLRNVNLVRPPLRIRGRQGIWKVELP